MNRRDLLRRSALTVTALAVRARAQQALTPEAPNPAIKRVLVVTKCHLDVGFTDTQANVVRKYFDVYYPAAIEVASHWTLHQKQFTAGAAGGGPVGVSASLSSYPKYTWTTGSWLLYTYLEQATPEQRRRMEQAIADGDIAWHALPFSWQTEVLSPSLIAGGLAFSQELDRRFGRKTTGAKMTDVPGHTRGLIAPLAQAGVTLLDIGVNAASTPPVVPDVFRWQDHAGHEVTVLYHRHDYGSTLLVPNSDLAVDVEVKNDNGGPHTLDEITIIYARLRRDYPNSAIHAASLTQVADAVAPFRKNLPVVTGEIGDTWIYGIPSDPAKVARFLELSRLRDEWFAAGKLKSGDAVDRAYLQHLLLSAEHTWGTDTKTYLDYAHYRPAEIAAAEAAHLPGYAKMETSWQEKRDNITAAVATLPAPLQDQASARLLAITPRSENDSPIARQPTPGPAALTLENRELVLKLDPATGALTSLLHKRSGRNWASAEHPLALLTYQTLAADEFAHFIARYLMVDTWWGPRDFGKPEIANFGAIPSEMHPRLAGGERSGTSLRPVAAHGTLLELAFDAASGVKKADNLALPQRTLLQISLGEGGTTVDITLTVLGKPANRLPEALWLTFNPVAPDPKGWLLTKSGQPVLPAEVLEGGGRAMHAVTGDIRYADAHGALTLRSLDAPVVALGTRSPLNFSRDLPDLAGGLHVSLFNNAWGTNYPQWASGDWQYRFTLTVSQGG